MDTHILNVDKAYITYMAGIKHKTCLIYINQQKKIVLGLEKR